MSRHLQKAGIIAIAAVLFLLVASCSRPQSNAGVEKREELAQQFMVELRDDILPYRNNPSKMYEMGLLVSGGPESYGLEYLGKFYQEYKDDKSTQVTIAFTNVSPMIVTRMGFADGTGYYFRYELKEDETIAVTSKPIDEVNVTSDLEAGKLNLTVFNGGVSMVSFTFNIPEETGTSK